MVNHPNVYEYINSIFSEFIELRGDRISSNDKSIICGIGKLDNINVTIVGQIKGNNLSEDIEHGFSMTKPAGFRKALRIMKQAEKFKRPIICFVDTIGADPSYKSEESGQISAIANLLMEMMYIRVPIITVLIGNGVSGGALSLCVADKIFALEYAELNVISTKALEQIISNNAPEDKENYSKNILNGNAKNLEKLHIVDRVITADANKCNLFSHEKTLLKKLLINEINCLSNLPLSILLKKRYKKHRNIGKEHKTIL